MVRAKNATKRKNHERKLAREEAKQVTVMEESAPDLDENFDAYMAAIEAEEVQVAKNWNDWNEGLLPDEDFSTKKEFFWSADVADALKASSPSKASRLCSHHLQPFTFKVGEQEYTLYGSAFSDRKSEPQADKAGVCVFLDPRWMQEYRPVWINPAMAEIMGNRVQAKLETPTIFLDWPDMGVLEIEDLKHVVSYLANVIDIGVEIGCMGGHGRTGTLMALVMVQLGCDAEEAIQTIRTDYCDKAIETKKQENLIKAFAKRYEVQG